MTIDEDLEIDRLQGRGTTSWRPWEERILCLDVQDRKRRHVCRLCQRKLPPRRAYCSEVCRLAFEQDHFWGLARHRALRRAKLPGTGRWRYRCAKCEGETDRPEVNHITPVVGGYRSVSCLNHEENLEVLCHNCHLGETAGQRAARAQG